jgi:sugar/nucleoside kinase (ribokinase family)
MAFGTGLIALDVILDAQLDSTGPHLAAGGTCGNVLAILSYLGWESHAIARFGSDTPSRRVQRLLAEAGVSLDFAKLTPSSETPIILQTNSVDAQGRPSHRFTNRCPACGGWWPSYRPITLGAAEEVAMAVSLLAAAGLSPQLFFFDRVSPAALLLAAGFAEVGALVVFEPTGFSDERLFLSALRLSHVVKYADDRAERFRHLLGQVRSAADGWLLEVETMGFRGLRFRAPRSGVIDWRHVAARYVPYVHDTAGAGDWCTAVLLDRLARGGMAGFRQLSSGLLEQHIVLAQAYAALSCGFRGSRGLMECVSAPATAAKARQLLLRSSDRAARDVSRVELQSTRHRASIRFPFCAVCA